jgi:tetratricopeptide (TPR) repeat protein
MITLARIGFGIIVGSAVVGLSWASAKWQDGGRGYGVPLSRQESAERFQKLMAPCTDLQRRAAQAEARGDFAGAERLLLESNRVAPKFLGGHASDFQLVELHEKMGKYKEALAGYKWELSHGENQTQILTRIGDLDLIYGSKEDARKEYMRAAEAPCHYTDKTFAPVAAGEPVGNTASLTQLRAAAYYNAGTYYRSCGQADRAEKYLALALSLEPNDALMRFGYSFMTHDPQAEMWLAEKEATGVLKEALHRWRVRDGSTNGSTHIWMNGGHPIQTVTPYVPKGVTKTNPNGNIFTPHVVDPIMQGRAGWMWEGSSRALRL